MTAPLLALAVQHVPTVRVGERLPRYSTGELMHVNEDDLIRLLLLRGLTIGAAMSRSTVEYGYAARLLGVADTSMGRYCDLLAYDCDRRGEPNLPALVVSRTTGNNTGWDGSSERPAIYRHWSPA